MSRNVIRDDERPKGREASTDKAVAKLLSGEIRGDHEILTRLRRKYTDEQIIIKIFDEFKKAQKFILDKARKFRHLLLEKYSYTLPAHEIVRKAERFKKKYEMTDSEFAMFLKFVMTDKEYISGIQSLPNTKMSKTLGYGRFMTSLGKLNIKDKEMPILKEILTLYQTTKQLHNQLILQSLSYQDCETTAMIGTFDPKKDNIYSYIHPVLAALFLPKIDLLDEHILLANLGYIIERKQKERDILSKPDAELYWDLITDPNDHACDMKSPITDLKNRYILQTRIWDCVINLRQGRYYHKRLGEFLMAINNCRSGLYDAPDLAYIRDEGAILRKIMGAFSLRPTVVSTSRLYGTIERPFFGAYTSGPLTAQNITKLTTIPMITVRLPIEITGGRLAVHLKDALNRPQWYVENKTIVPKAQTILHSREIIFFYVNRRFQTINITRLNTPYNFSTLPLTVAGWESLNDHPVYFDDSMTILNDVYKLRSVVFVDYSPSRKNLIIGCSAGIICQRSEDNGTYDEVAFLYQPQAAGHAYYKDGKYKRDSPITWLPKNGTLNDDEETFDSLARTRGTIFMYQKVVEGDHPFIKTKYGIY